MKVLDRHVKRPATMYYRHSCDLVSSQHSQGFCHSGQSSAEIWDSGATLPHSCCQFAPQEDWTVLGSETQSRATFYHGFGQPRGVAGDNVLQEDLQLASNQPSQASWHSGQGCYRRLVVVTQTNTLMEILIQNNTLQRFGLARMGSGRYKGTLL